MPSVSSLKDRARKEEKRGNWSRAVDLYRQALARAERDGDLMRELGLYNRIGDLHLRMEDTERAVESFLEAVERYTEEDLQAPAVAMCNKILRLDPNRDGVRMRLVRLHLRSGLVADARQALLEFVRRADASGREEEALEAILEFLGSEDEESLRLEAAGRLADAERAEEAVEHLLAVRDARADRGEPVAEVEARIRSLAPGVLDQPEAESLASEAPGATPERAPEKAASDAEAAPRAEPEVDAAPGSGVPEVARREAEAPAEATHESEPEADVPAEAEPAVERRRRGPAAREEPATAAGPLESAAHQDRAGAAESVEESGPREAPRAPPVARHRRALPTRLPPLSPPVPAVAGAVAPGVACALPAEARAPVPDSRAKGAPELGAAELHGATPVPDASRVPAPDPRPRGFSASSAVGAEPRVARPLPRPVVGGPEARAPAGPMALVRFRLAGSGFSTLAAAGALPEIPGVAPSRPSSGPYRALGRLEILPVPFAPGRPVRTAVLPGSPEPAGPVRERAVPVVVAELPQPASGVAAGIAPCSASTSAPGPIRVDGRPVDPGLVEATPAPSAERRPGPAAASAATPAEVVHGRAVRPAEPLWVGHGPAPRPPEAPVEEDEAAGKERSESGGVLRSLRRMGLFGGRQEEEPATGTGATRRSVEGGPGPYRDRTGEIPGLAPPVPGAWGRPVRASAAVTVPAGPVVGERVDVAERVAIAVPRLATAPDLAPVRAPWETPDASGSATENPSPEEEPASAAGTPASSAAGEALADTPAPERAERAAAPPPEPGEPPRPGERLETAGTATSGEPADTEAEPRASEAEPRASEVEPEVADGAEREAAETEPQAGEAGPEASPPEPGPAEEPEDDESEAVRLRPEKEHPAEEGPDSGAPEIEPEASEEAEPEAAETEPEISEQVEPEAAEAPVDPEIDEEPDSPDPAGAERATEESLTTLLRRRWADLTPPSGPPAGASPAGESEPAAAAEPVAEAQPEASPAVEAGSGEPGADDLQGGAEAASLEELLAPEIDRDEDFPDLTAMLERMGWLGGGEASPVDGDEEEGEAFVHPSPWKEGSRREQSGTAEVEPAGVEGAVTDEDVPDLTGMLRSLGWLGGDEEADEDEPEASEGEKD